MDTPIVGVRGSQNYIWSLDGHISTEATGKVYRGRHKQKGAWYSVKVIKSENHTELAELWQKECEMLKKLDHENIIKLLTTERDLKSNESIMVMEYCNQGNLHSIIERPENVYGLPEKDFLCLLRDLVSGLEHLHIKKVVHGDLKPEKIMQHQTADGQFVYKLIDFGLSHDLDCEAKFNNTSSHGTGEYQKGTTQSSVDLWGLGVTLFQAATGQFPFQQLFEGAQIIEDIMFSMMSEKPNECICGIQSVQDGPVEWSRKLPDSCNISCGLQSLIVPLLARLLETNSEKIIKFKKLYDEVQTITNMMIVFVFDLSTSSILHIYCDNRTCMSEFQQLVDQQTEISVTDQMLVYESHFLFELISKQECISFPPTSSNNPIILFSTSHQPSVTSFFPKLPDMPNVLKTIDLMKDISSAKRFCGELCCLRRLISDIHLKQDLIQKAINMYQFLVCQKLDEEQRLICRSELLLKDFIQRLSVIYQNRDLVLQITCSASGQLHMKDNTNIDIQKQLSMKTEKQVEEVGHSLFALSEQIETDRFLSLDWVSHYGCQEKTQCLKKMDFLVEAAVEIKDEFETKLISKLQLKKNFEKGLSLVSGHCLTNIQSFYEQAMNWYRQFQSVNEKINGLQIKGRNISETLALLTENIDQLQIQLIEEWLTLSKDPETGINPTSLLQKLQSNKATSKHKVINGEFIFQVRKKQVANKD